MFSGKYGIIQDYEWEMFKDVRTCITGGKRANDFSWKLLSKINTVITYITLQHMICTEKQ